MSGASGLPPYAYRLGCTPHPRRDPRGHSFGLPEPRAERFDRTQWRESSAWTHARELFEAGYWWESHEWLEALWRAFGSESPEGRLLKALVQVAAAQLQGAAGRSRSASRLARRARGQLDALPGELLGVDLTRLAFALQQWVDRPGIEPIPIPLVDPAGEGSS